jgi:hypothetical protein
MYKYTPAILQKFLFKHRNDSIDVILKNIDEFSEMCGDNPDKSVGMYM